MKKLEIILIFGAVIGLLLALLDVPLRSLIVSLFCVALGLLYFYLGFALFNGVRLRKIFEPESYKGIGAWRIATAIGTGMALSHLMIGLMFTILSYLMAETFLTIGLVLTVGMSILAVIKYARGKDQFYRDILIRCLVFIVIAFVFLSMPGHIFEKP